MPGLNQDIVVGFKGPEHTPGPNQVREHEKTQVGIPLARYVNVEEGYVQFHSVHRRYRVQFQTPAKEMRPDGSMVIPDPVFLQFEDNSVITNDPKLIHFAKGCPESDLICPEHREKCAAGCVKTGKYAAVCRYGHKDIKTQKPLKAHRSYGLRGEFWDASEMRVANKAAQKNQAINAAKAQLDAMPPEEAAEFLKAIGADSYNLPKRDKPKGEDHKEQTNG